MKAKPLVVVGLLGTTLDRGSGAKRWEKWRPSVSICQHEDLLVSRFVLLYQKKFSSLLAAVAGDIRQVSPETEIERKEIEFSNPWDFEEVYEGLHDFAHSYPFEPDDEEYLINITTGSHVAQICLFLLTESRALPGRLLQSSPPRRRQIESPGEYSIIDLDLSRYDRMAQRFRREAEDEVSLLKSGIETRNADFNRMIEQIERVAAHSQAPILLMGPTGAGKSQLARRIYELKKARRQLGGEFVEVNCATLRGDAAMSALFGHKKGAFTGAVSDRPGLLRAADGGMLFLDEVAELGDDEQAMLLRALEEGKFLPLGSDKEAESHFQLVCGTNRDLAAEVPAGAFREDLYSRINLWTFRMPGLRDRREDIRPNLQYELDQYAGRAGTHVTFSKQARELFLKFATSPEALWSANFRDLNGAMTRMATLAPGGRITEDVVREEMGRLKDSWTKPGVGTGDNLEGLLDPGTLEELDLFDRVQLAEVVRVCGRSRSLSEAGRILFSASRKKKKSSNDADRLRKYLGRFGLEWNSISER